MGSAILIAPVFDDVTAYSYDWSREVEKLLLENGYNVLSLSGRPLRRDEVEEALKSRPNAIIIFYDHGREDSLLASQTENAIDTKNAHLLRGRECYTLACSSASGLGVEAYRNGCLAYWGYTREFGFTTDSLEEFRQFANSGIKLRIKEKLSWRQCLEETKKLAKQLIGKLLSTGRIIAAIIMQQDADALVCYTPDNPPTTKCFLRKIALKIFGLKLGWRISRKHAVALLLMGGGLGTYIHDRIVESAVLGSRIHGIDIGFMLITVSWLILSMEIIRWLKNA
ncbi:MAG: hypothetical protein QXZ14_12000 [Candidatus Jordarchaeales archaeon]